MSAVLLPNLSSQCYFRCGLPLRPLPQRLRRSLPVLGKPRGMELPSEVEASGAYCKCGRQ